MKNDKTNEVGQTLTDALNKRLHDSRCEFGRAKKAADDEVKSGTAKIISETGRASVNKGLVKISNGAQYSGLSDATAKSLKAASKELAKWEAFPLFDIMATVAVIEASKEAAKDDKKADKRETVKA